MQKICKVCGKTSGGLVPPSGFVVTDALDWASDELCLVCSRTTAPEAPKKTKGVYIGAPACFALEQACQTVREAFGNYGMYIVGSCLDRPDWRDVDVRYIMADEEFEKLFPDAHPDGSWELNPRWLLLTVSISQWLSKQTGLPIDFQFQPQTHANKRHPGKRNAVGIRLAKQPTKGSVHED